VPEYHAINAAAWGGRRSICIFRPRKINLSSTFRLLYSKKYPSVTMHWRLTPTALLYVGAHRNILTAASNLTPDVPPQPIILPTQLYQIIPSPNN
jgi:hypothetical protein